MNSQLKNLVSTRIANKLNIKIKEFTDNSKFGLYEPIEDCIYINIELCKQHKLPLEQVMFHELAHATGHQRRLNRLKYDKTGWFDINKEEVIAEYTAYQMCRMLEIEPNKEHSIQYIRQYSNTNATKLISYKQDQLVNKAIAYLMSVY